MKIKQLVWFVLLMGSSTGIAYAELVSGRVTSIDASGQNITLRRADTNGTMKVHVADTASLNGLEAGRQVHVDTSRNGDVLEAQFFKLVPKASSEK